MVALLQTLLEVMEMWEMAVAVVPGVTLQLHAQIFQVPQA
jgi:hypothetical protein